MAQLPDYTDVSVALSEVLAEMGLNKVIVNERRRTSLVRETIGTLSYWMTGRNNKMYMFGSQIEGTTTIGLNSDIDAVICLRDKMNVIHKLEDWKHGDCNLLMVKAEATPPGYCMLQILREDYCVPETEIFTDDYFRDRQGNIFLKNTNRMNGRVEDQEQHGPAFSFQSGNGMVAFDLVPAYECASQLPVVEHWLSQLHGRWPSEDMKRYIESSQCFVVPVGSRGSAYETLEWRISTTLGERCLMFNLNVTQLQVYVLMKMFLKTSINYNVPKENHISSFMCKTVVLHCVQNTDPNTWESHMLVQCFLFSLFTLFSCVLLENCPHFIIRSNNLMAGRFTQHARYQLQQNLRCLFDDIKSRGARFLYLDDVANSLMLKLNPVEFGIRCHASDEECQAIFWFLRVTCAETTLKTVQALLQHLTKTRLSGSITLLQHYVQHLEHVYLDGSTIERTACRLLRPYFYTFLGSLTASESIQNTGIISPEALAFFSRGLNSDVASSRLKLSSVFLCAGEMESAEIRLRDLKGRYDTSVYTPVCPCTALIKRWLPTRLVASTLASDESGIQKITSTCVIFTQCEKNCIPQELQYEMYRSTPQDLLHRRQLLDDWMDWAVVDCLPYLHFLCYQVYGRLERRADQQKALYKLLMTIQTEPDLGHKETALNLLGQCMEQESRWNCAVKYYRWSLNIRPRNNAAKFHVGRLLCMRYRQCRV